VVIVDGVLISRAFSNRSAGLWNAADIPLASSCSASSTSSAQLPIEDTWFSEIPALVSASAGSPLCGVCAGVPEALSVKSFSVFSRSDERLASWPGLCAGICAFGFGFLSRLRGTAGTIGRIRRGLLFAEIGLGVTGGPRRGAIVGLLG
jgi:hypothetical protein